MFSTIKRLLGNITVETKKDRIYIEGLPADVIARDISRIWGTSRINKHMFISTGSSRVVIPSFFLIEFMYALNTISSETKSGVSKKTIARVLELLAEKTWLNKEFAPTETILDFSQLKQINGTLKDYQQEFLNQYATAVPKFDLKGYMLAAVPGSGKTLIGLALGLTLKVDATIVVCPKNAVAKVWVSDIRKFLPANKTIWTSTDGTPPPAGMDYYIVHYEYLTTFLSSIKIFDGKKVFIDLDECHNFNEPASVRTNAFVTLCRETNCKNVLWASGTPLKAMAKEMIAFLRTVDPYFTEDSETRFKAIFGMSVGRAADILSHRLGLVSFKVEKSRFMDDVPTVTRVDIKVPDGDRFTLRAIKGEMVAFINARFKYYRENSAHYTGIYENAILAHQRDLSTPKAKADFEEYRRVVNILRRATDYRQLAREMKYSNDYESANILPNLVGPNREAFRKAKGVYKYVELVIRGEALGGVLGKRRAECIAALVEHIDFGSIIDDALKKTLIFTSYVDVVDVTSLKLSKLGYKPMVVYGDTNKHLEAIIKKFDEDPDANPLIATLQSLSTAVPVTSANTTIFLNSPFRDFERTQAISRTHRLGQDAPTFVFDMFLDTGNEPNISTRSGDIMEWSKAQVDMIMGKSGKMSIDSIADVGMEGFYKEWLLEQAELGNDIIPEV